MRGAPDPLELSHKKVTLPFFGGCARCSAVYCRRLIRFPPLISDAAPDPIICDTLLDGLGRMVSRRLSPVHSPFAGCNAGVPLPGKKRGHKTDCL